MVRLECRSDLCCINAERWRAFGGEGFIEYMYDMLYLKRILKMHDPTKMGGVKKWRVPLHKIMKPRVRKTASSCIMHSSENIACDAINATHVAALQHPTRRYVQSKYLHCSWHRDMREEMVPCHIVD